MVDISDQGDMVGDGEISKGTGTGVWVGDTAKRFLRWPYWERRPLLYGKRSTSSTCAVARVRGIVQGNR